MLRSARKIVPCSFRFCYVGRACQSAKPLFYRANAGCVHEYVSQRLQPLNPARGSTLLARGPELDRKSSAAYARDYDPASFRKQQVWPAIEQTKTLER